MNIKTLIGIPVFNEETVIIFVIQGLINEFKEEQNIDILIINDGSNDSTIEKILVMIGGKIKLISNEKRLGIGSCINLGFKFASENHYHYYVSFPGNHKISINSLKSAITFSLNTNTNLTIGSRFIQGGKYEQMPFYRYILVIFFSYVFSNLLKKTFTDITCGLRIVKVKDWTNKELVPFNSQYSAEQIIILKSLHLDYTIAEVPVEIVYKKILRPKSHLSILGCIQIISPWFHFYVWKLIKTEFLKPKWLT